MYETTILRSGTSHVGCDYVMHYSRACPKHREKQGEDEIYVKLV